MGIAKPQSFLEEVSKCSTIVEVRAGARAEKKYLKRQYSTIGSLKAGFTIYRNYLKAHILAEKKVDEKPLLATLLKILRLSPKQQEMFTLAGAIEVRSNKSNLRQLHDVKAYIDKAVLLLESKSYVDQVIGLCALTGRRAAEIGATARFKFIDEYRVEFSGQLKTKGRADVLPYEIPVLFSASKLIETLENIRREKERFIDKPTLFHDAVSKVLGLKIKQHFTGFFEGEPKVKDLRAIYALISFREFNKVGVNKKVDRDVYFAKILGHSENDTTTCGSYVDFFVG